MKHANTLILVLGLVILVELGFLYKHSTEYYRFYRVEDDEDEDEDEDEDVFEDAVEFKDKKSNVTVEDEDEESYKLYDRILMSLLELNTENLNNIQNIQDLENKKEKIITYYTTNINNPLFANINDDDKNELKAHYDFIIMEIDNRNMYDILKEKTKILSRNYPIGNKFNKFIDNCDFTMNNKFDYTEKIYSEELTREILSIIDK